MKQHEGEHPFGHYGQIISFVLFIVVWGLDSFRFHFLPQIGLAVPPLVRISLFVVLVTFAIVLMNDGHRVLSDDHKVGKLATDGYFRITRHPLYLGILIFYLALSILTASFLSFMSLIFIFIYYDFIARYEEKYLYLKFGESYLNYWKKTPKWLFFKNRIKHGQKPN